MGDETADSARSNAATNHASPYYLHPSDYPRTMHVNEALNDNNFPDWLQEMETFLFAKIKIGFVDGTVPKPEKTHADHMPWLRCDAMIREWLTTAMEKEIRVSVKYANSAEEIWKDLQERFGKESAPRAYELKQQLMTTKQDGSSVSAYYTRLRALWDEINSVFSVPKCSCTGCACDISKKLLDSRNKERLYEFLLGLDNDFSTIRTQILAMKLTPTIGEAYHLVSEDEQQRAASTGKKTNVNSAAFHAFMKKEETGPARSRNTPKHNKRTNDEKAEHCTFCDRDGHNRDGCFKLIGYPDWWPGKGKTDKGKARAAHVERTLPAVRSGAAPPTTAESNVNSANQTGIPIPGLNDDQYQQFLRLFRGKVTTNGDTIPPVANMAGRSFEGLEFEDIDWNGVYIG